MRDGNLRLPGGCLISQAQGLLEEGFDALRLGDGPYDLARGEDPQPRRGTVASITEAGGGRCVGCSLSSWRQVWGAGEARGSGLAMRQEIRQLVSMSPRKTCPC